MKTILFSIFTTLFTVFSVSSILGQCNLHTLDFGPNPICENDKIVTEWLIDGDNLSEVGFDIYVNDAFELFVPWNSTSWYDFDINNPGTPTFTIQVCDNDNPDCCKEWTLDNPCYMGACDLHTLDFGPNPICENNKIVTEWLIDGDNLSEVGFDIYLNDAFELFVPWNSTSWYDFDINNPGTPTFTIQVCDNDNPDCCKEWTLDNPCYMGACDLHTLDFGPNPICENNKIVTEWLIDGDNLSEVGFDIYLNDAFELFVPWNSTSWYDFDINNPGTPTFTIQVCDNDNPDCCKEWTLDNPCYMGACDLHTLDFGPNPICENDKIVTEWLIDGDNLSEVGFDIYVNDAFELFVPWNSTSWYDFDINNPGTPTFTIQVCDNDDPDCCKEWTLDNPCYMGACDLHTLDFGPNPICENDKIVTEWLIDGDNLSEVGFDIYVNDAFELFVPWNSTSWYDFDINNPGTPTFTIQVCDNDNPDCCKEWTLDNPCYMGACDLHTLDFGPNPICENDKIVTEWLIDGHNLSEVGFDIYVNDAFELFVPWNSTSWYDFDINNPGTPTFTIQVCDNDNPDCCKEWTLDNPCYMGACDLHTLDFGPNPICENDKIVTEWLIDGDNLSEVGFDIYVNDAFELFVPWNSTSWYDFDINNPGTPTFTIQVCDNDNPDCCKEWTLDNPCYMGACDLHTLDFGPNPICENDKIVTEWLIDGDNLSEVGFDIYVNDAFELFVPWNSTSWYDFDINNPGTPTFTIQVCDNDNPDCCKEWTLDNPCYMGACDLHTLDFGPNPICENDKIVTEWLIDGDNLSEVGFDIYVNDAFELFVPWNSTSWYDFDINNPGTPTFTIQVCDNDNPDCCKEWTLDNPCPFGISNTVESDAKGIDFFWSMDLNTMFISGAHMDKYTFHVYDVNGKLVIENNTIDEGEKSLDLDRGLYFVSVRGNDQLIMTQRIVVAK